MSISIKIAQWLAPQVFERASDLCNRSEYLAAQTRTLITETDKQRLALRQIISLRTPNCAHVGKRMAEIAEAAIKREA